MARTICNQSRLEKIRLLKAARRLISTRKEYYVCRAILQAARNISWSSNYEPATELRTYIQRSLKGRLFLEGWQMENFRKLEGKRDGRKDRLAWIDWMIASLEAKN